MSSIIGMDDVQIQGMSCFMVSIGRGTPTEHWVTAGWYKSVNLRTWLIFPAAQTRQKAIDNADFILGDRERLGCFLMDEGDRRLRDATMTEVLNDKDIKIRKWFELEAQDALYKLSPELRENIATKCPQ